MEENKQEFEINKVNELGIQLQEAIKNNPNKPTEEEIKAAEEEFNIAVNTFTIKSWNIGNPEEALEYINYLIHYNEKRIFWTKNGWMGVIKLTEELTDSKKFIESNPLSPLKLGYQAIEFIFQSFQNPGGVGLQSALDFEAENTIYVKLFDLIGDALTDARTELKNIQFLQDKHTAMQQGFYLEVEPADVEETILPEKNIVLNEVITKDIK
jgi:hypothetical protein